MQITGMHFKQQVRQPKNTAMDNKCHVQLAIIDYSVALDEILEANMGDVSCPVLNSSISILVLRCLEQNINEFICNSL